MIKSVINELSPTVSVCCITYNHERFLVQTIESVLMQATDFRVEMVIGEDCSTDSTRRIAQEYEKQYPGRIRVLAQNTNLGIMPNLMATMAACKGEYIAFLEGDDYWTDINKLQIQVDALRANAECALCFHDAEIFHDAAPDHPVMIFSQQVASHALPPPTAQGSSLQFTQLDLARAGWIIPSASMLFRARSLPQPLPAWFAGVYSGDYTLQLLSTRWGSALYLPRLMSRYRLHENGITSITLQSVYQFERRIYEARMFQKYVFEPRHRIHADIYLSIQCKEYARYLGSEKKRWPQLKYLFQVVYYGRQRVRLFLERRLNRKIL